MTDVGNEIQTSQSVEQRLQEWRRQLIRGVLVALVVVGGLAAAGAIYDAIISDQRWQILIIGLAYLLLLGVTLWRSVPYVLGGSVLLALLYAMAILNFFLSGQTGDSFPFLLVIPFLAALLFGRRVGVVALVVTGGTILVFGFVFITELVVIPHEDLSTVTDVGSWISRGLVWVLLALLLLLPQNFVFQRLSSALGDSVRLARTLRESQETLEQQVADRTAELTRRARYLEATTEVARGASALLESQETLLERVVDLISQQFALYHTGLFLVDESGEWAELRAASSEGGRRMLAREHRLRVGVQGIVGYVAERGVHRLVLDVGQDAVQLNNPDLPETRSEMALPLRARGQVIGVLDVQSVEPGAFSDEDVGVLQALADQVAVAISNARLFQQAEAALVSERKVRGELTREAWAGLLRSAEVQGFQSDASGTRAVQDEWDEEMLAAVTTGEIAEGTTERAIAVPVKARGQVIGVIDAHLPDETSEWTAEQRQLLESVAEQLGVALESAQLYREAQSLAARERLTAEITGQMRSTMSMDELLQTAIRETARALDASRAFVQWVPSDEAQDQGGAYVGLGE